MSSLPSNNPEKPVNNISTEQQLLITGNWFKSVSKIDYLVKSKKREYKTENIDNFIYSEIEELREVFPEDSEVTRKLEEVRKRQLDAPHRNDVISGKCIAIDDQDKVVLIYFWNEEQAYGAKNNMSELRLEVEFLFKSPVDVVDRSKKISYALVTDNKTTPISIFTQDQKESTSVDNAKIITETLDRLASDPDLDKKSLTVAEANQLTPPTGPL